MAYGIIRVREISRGEIASTQLHNSREYEEKGLDIPEHINPKMIEQNSEYFKTGSSLKEAIDNRIASAEVKEKKNSVVGIEFVVSASSDFFTSYDSKAYFDKVEDWLSEKYGKENVVARNDHFDESTPHAHFVVVPIVKKEVKWKNDKGEGVKESLRLCARDLTGDKEKLVKLQDDYFEFLDKKFNPRLEKSKFVRGKNSIEQERKYIKQTIPELGVLKNEIESIRESIVKINNEVIEGIKTHENAIIQANALLQEIERKEKESIKLQEQVIQHEKNIEKAEKRHEENKGDAWKKDFEPYEAPKPSITKAPTVKKKNQIGW
jgi:hypothetical protein